MLATSQAPMGVLGETCMRVPSLSLPDAEEHETPPFLAATKQYGCLWSEHERHARALRLRRRTRPPWRKSAGTRRYPAGDRAGGGAPDSMPLER